MHLRVKYDIIATVLYVPLLRVGDCGLVVSDKRQPSCLGLDFRARKSSDFGVSGFQGVAMNRQTRAAGVKSRTGHGAVGSDPVVLRIDRGGKGRALPEPLPVVMGLFRATGAAPGRDA
ncbi:hypothetical protein YS110_22605 (plasmid) [Acidovorax sp. YS12]|nr:hypothetical protein YS110_22605 [Acidovorax sp. YS12]